MELEWSPLQVKVQESLYSGKIQYYPSSKTLSVYCDNLSRNLFSAPVTTELKVQRSKTNPLNVRFVYKPDSVEVSFHDLPTSDAFFVWFHSVDSASSQSPRHSPLSMESPSSSSASSASHSNSSSISPPLPLAQSVLGQPPAPKQYVTVDVTQPTRVFARLAPNDKFVIYNVHSKSNLPLYKGGTAVDNVYSHTVRKRYTEFTTLRAKLKENHPLVNIPELPAVSYTNRFNAEFLAKRSLALKEFLCLLTENKRLFEAVELKDFLTVDAIGNVTIDNTNTTQVVSNLEHYLGGLELNYLSTQTIDKSQFATQAEKDLDRLQALSAYWQVETREIPFEKFVVLVLGTTSAGKSSWINHFFGVNIKKTADNQQDTYFSFIEVVTAEEFAKHTPTHDKSHFASFSAEQLQENIRNVDTDPRLNHVFVYLDGESTITRYYKHLTKYSKDIRAFAVFKTILINETYLMNFKSYPLTSKTILIDSPGFVAEKDILNNIEEMSCNLNIYQAIYSFSDKLLFFMPAPQLQMVYNQLVTLELTILASYPDVGVSNIVNRLKQAKRNHQAEEGEENNGIMSLIGGVVKSLFGYQKNSLFKGTTCWDKTFFILSKVDLLEGGMTNYASILYDLGGIFKGAFTVFPNPVFDNIIPICLPSKSKHTNGSNVSNNLDLLYRKLHNHSLACPYEKRIESTIQIMAETLLSHLKKSTISYYYSGKEFTEIQQIQQASLKRMNL